MPTEAQILAWIYVNWPSVALGLTAGITYAVLYSRLQAFLTRVEKTEKELLRLSRELLHVKIKLSKVVMTHCTLNPQDMERLMKIDESELEE